MAQLCPCSWLMGHYLCIIRWTLDHLTVVLWLKPGSLHQLIMLVQGVKYNIPVSLWLPERYPNVAPIMYVVPTPDMIIKPRHAFVDASGVVNSAYLRNWSQPHSTLMIMCNDVSIQFGQDPPLFSKPPGWVPPGPTQSHQQSPQRPVQQPSRAQSPANQQADQHHHTFQAENPMIRYGCCHQLDWHLQRHCCCQHTPPQNRHKHYTRGKASSEGLMCHIAQDIY